MTIHFFIKSDKSAGSSRHRAFLVAEELRKRGLAAVVHEPPLVLASATAWPKKIKLIARYLTVFTHIKKNDVVYLQRTIYNKYFFVLIILFKLLFRRKMIFDFDDAIYLHSNFKTKTLTKLSDAVVVGGHALRDWAGNYNKNVYIIPTSISFADYEKFSRFKRGNNAKFTIGWVGNAIDHYENLKILVSMFEKLVRDGLLFKFILVGALGDKKIYELFGNIKGLDVKFIDLLEWTQSGVVPKMIQNFDIGLMPLLDTEWNAGKCAFKAVEYMACGVPAVVSPVGENKYLVEDGKNGFLAGKTEEWVDKVKRLYDNSDLLDKLGAEAQKTIKDKYSYEANIPILESILKKL